MKTMSNSNTQYLILVLLASISLAAFAFTTTDELIPEESFEAVEVLETGSCGKGGGGSPKAKTSLTLTPKAKKGSGYWSTPVYQQCSIKNAKQMSTECSSADVDVYSPSHKEEADAVINKKSTEFNQALTWLELYVHKQVAKQAEKSLSEVAVEAERAADNISDFSADDAARKKAADIFLAEQLKAASENSEKMFGDAYANTAAKAATRPMKTLAEVAIEAEQSAQTTSDLPADDAARKKAAAAFLAEQLKAGNDESEKKFGDAYANTAAQAAKDIEMEDATRRSALDKIRKAKAEFRRALLMPGNFAGY